MLLLLVVHSHLKLDPKQNLHVFIKLHHCIHCITRSALQLRRMFRSSFALHLGTIRSLGSQHDWSWKKLLKLHILVGLYHVKSFQDKQSNNQSSVIIMHCDYCDRQESGIICLVWVVITFYCALKLTRARVPPVMFSTWAPKLRPFKCTPAKLREKG